MTCDFPPGKSLNTSKEEEGERFSSFYLEEAAPAAVSRNLATTTTTVALIVETSGNMLINAQLMRLPLPTIPWFSYLVRKKVEKTK